jgi:thiol-disulfide isomerase/thioredoxin
MPEANEVMHADTSLTEQAQQSPSLLKTRWFWAVLISLTLVLGGSWIIFSRALLQNVQTDASALEPAPVAGHPAPPFELVTLEGEILRLSDLRGKPVILNFWATWCGPCRAEFPEFQKAAVDNADRLVMIGINNTSIDRADLVPDFLTEFGITFPIALDPDGEMTTLYQIKGLPTTIFIDSNGIVNEVFPGPLNKAYIESKISELSGS